MQTLQMNTEKRHSFEDFITSNLLLIYIEVKVNCSDEDEIENEISKYTLQELYKQYCDDHREFVTKELAQSESFLQSVENKVDQAMHDIFRHFQEIYNASGDIDPMKKDYLDSLQYEISRLIVNQVSSNIIK